MSTAAKKQKYRMAMIDAGDGKMIRVRVIPFDGCDGYEVKWTEACSGCSGDGPEYNGGTIPTKGAGCHECGYTGKRVRCEWVPLNSEEAEKSLWKHST